VLEDLLEAGEAVLDPLDRRTAEDLLPTAAEAIDLRGERFDSALGPD
jgi:hypothetical protein